MILFTSALFLSGYAIQQRTLRDLRLAIRPDPRPAPKIYLPDRFKQSTTELPDGRVVDLDDGEARDDDDISSGSGSSSRSRSGARSRAHGGAGQDRSSVRKDDTVVEVRPSVPGSEDGRAQKPVVAAGAAADDVKDVPGAAGGDKASRKQGGKSAKKGGDGKKKQEEKEKPISSAERRRRIKEEIRQLSQGEAPIYYQRRLW